MDTQWLEDVLILLEEGSMTRAAARRNITQPAFSRRIRGFETWLGQDILARGPNKIDISEALVANETEIRALIGRLHDLKSRIARFAPARSTIAIAAQHALISSVFSDFAGHALQAFPALKFRLRAGNQSECVSMFLRGDTHMLLSYETQGLGPLPFDTSVRREVWGVDNLIPIVGGKMRFDLKSDGTLPDGAPAVIYPVDSYFGTVLRLNKCPYGTSEFAQNPLCESAFSNGIAEMVQNGLGIGWLPHSMCYQELRSGAMIGLSQWLGEVPLKIAFYSHRADPIADPIQDFLAMRTEHAAQPSTIR
ncbi:MAG: LysR substrate-binding domain-containing protein [Roseobacter sp.]